MSAQAIYRARVAHVDIKITVFGSSEILQLTEVVFGKTHRIYRACATAHHLELFFEEDVIDERFRPLWVTRVVTIRPGKSLTVKSHLLISE